MKMTNALSAAHIVGLGVALALSTPAIADGMNGSVKDAPKAEGRKFEWTANIGATTDYVFRGFSQSAQKPAFQAGLDATYGLFYAGLWGSHIDFGSFTEQPSGLPRDVSGFAELDWYMGFKPVLGPVTFDLGVIYYTYPGARDGDSIATGRPREFDYIELKAGASTSALLKNLTLGSTLFYSPDYTNEQGEVWTLEGTAAYELPKVWIFTPTVGGTFGSQWGDFDRNKFDAGAATYFQANGKDSYSYWNAGIALAFDKLTLDFRYWDTNVKGLGAVQDSVGVDNYCKQSVFRCDERELSPNLGDGLMDQAAALG